MIALGCFWGGWEGLRIRGRRWIWGLGCALSCGLNCLVCADYLSRQYYAFDVVGELTFAKKLGFLEKGADVDNMMAAIDGTLLFEGLHPAY